MTRLRMLLPVMVLAVLWGLTFAPAVAASNSSFGFNMIGPNITEDLSSLDTIQVTGGGSFDTAAQTVVAAGSFTELNASGSVIARGSWTATAFVSFVSFGGPNPGIQGGQLMLTVTLFPNGGAPQPGLAMSVTCLVGSPPPGAIEGVTAGTFTQVKRGATLFHLNQ